MTADTLPKRPRGRPRKVKEDVEKRPRGRPRQPSVEAGSPEEQKMMESALKHYSAVRRACKKYYDTHKEEIAKNGKLRRSQKIDAKVAPDENGKN
jgi:RecA/RadA recombinase